MHEKVLYLYLVQKWLMIKSEWYKVWCQMIHAYVQSHRTDRFLYSLHSTGRRELPKGKAFGAAKASWVWASESVLMSSHTPSYTIYYLLPCYISFFIHIHSPYLYLYLTIPFFFLWVIIFPFSYPIGFCLVLLREANLSQKSPPFPPSSVTLSCSCQSLPFNTPSIYGKSALPLLSKSFCSFKKSLFSEKA